jgi:Tfp pilus assembly protein PilF
MPCLTRFFRLTGWPALAVALALATAGCATPGGEPAPPAAPAALPLLHDEAFGPPARPVRAEDVFALDDEMRRYIDHAIARHLRTAGRQQGLLAAMYDRNMLKLEYDGGVTRTAREAFQARSGNCLSLVILTAALADHLSLPVTFQSVEVEDSWSRSRGLLFVSGHVNLVIGGRLLDKGRGFGTNFTMTVDFLAPQDLRRRHVTLISKQRVLAMYFNNRAAETLGSGDLDQAYAYARAALLQDPAFPSAQITLGVVYHQRGLLAQAEAAFRHALRAQPTNTQALADLSAVLVTMGRDAEAQQVKQELARLEDFPPFHFFELGKAAVQRGDLEAGLAFLKRELSRDPDYHEVHFWLAQAYRDMGDNRSARRHLTLAVANSTTRSDHDLYAAKLDRLQGRNRH